MCLYEVVPRSGVNEIVHHSGHCHIEACLSARSFCELSCENRRYRIAGHKIG